MSGAQYMEALIGDIQTETVPKAPLLDAIDEIRAGNEHGRSSDKLSDELSERALISMAIYSAEVSAS